MASGTKPGPLPQDGGAGDKIAFEPAAMDAREGGAPVDEAETEETVAVPGARLAVLVHELLDLIYQMSAGDTMSIMYEAGITLPQMVTLQIVRGAGSLPIMAIGEILKLSTSATSHLVDRLVERGFLDRSEDPDDRRQKRIAITATGLELLDRLTRSRRIEFEKTFGAMEPEVRDELARLFESAITHLKNSGGHYCPNKGAPR